MLWEAPMFELFLELVAVDVVFVLSTYEDHQVIMTIFSRQYVQWHEAVRWC